MISVLEEIVSHGQVISVNWRSWLMGSWLVLLEEVVSYGQVISVLEEIISHGLVISVNWGGCLWLVCGCLVSRGRCLSWAGDSSDKDKQENFCDLFNLTNLVHTETCFMKNSRSIIDLILTNLYIFKKRMLLRQG